MNITCQFTEYNLRLTNKHSADFKYSRIKLQSPPRELKKMMTLSKCDYKEI